MIELEHITTMITAAHEPTLRDAPGAAWTPCLGAGADVE